MVTLDKVLLLLEQQGKSQKDLCEYLEINKQAFTNWKSGHTKSYQKYLPQIAEFLGCSVDYLLDKTDVKEKPTVKSGNELDNEIIKLFNELPSHLQEQAMRHLRFLASEKDSEDKK